MFRRHLLAIISWYLNSPFKLSLSFPLRVASVCKWGGHVFIYNADFLLYI
jgi:hypothetical protein